MIEVYIGPGVRWYFKIAISLYSSPCFKGGTCLANSPHSPEMQLEEVQHIGVKPTHAPGHDFAVLTASYIERGATGDLDNTLNALDKQRCVLDSSDL